MLLAVPEFKGRVAPTFDFCRHLTFWRADGQGASWASDQWISKRGLDDRVLILLSRRVEVLLCGTIGRDLEQLLRLRGIQVRPHFSGPVAQAVSTFATNAFSSKLHSVSARCPDPMLVNHQGHDVHSPSRGGDIALSRGRGRADRNYRLTGGKKNKVAHSVKTLRHGRAY